MTLYTWLQFVVKRGCLNSVITYVFKHVHFSLWERNKDKERCSFLLRILARSHNIPLARINHLYLLGYKGLLKIWCLFTVSSKNWITLLRKKLRVVIEGQLTVSAMRSSLCFISEHKSSVFNFPPEKICDPIQDSVQKWHPGCAWVYQMRIFLY